MGLGEEGFKLTVRVVSNVAQFFAIRWSAVVHPDIYRKNEEVKFVKTVMDADTDHEKKRLENFAKEAELYKAMGVPDSQIQDEIIPRIRQRTDPLSVIERLKREGKVINIRVVEQPKIPELPERNFPGTGEEPPETPPTQPSL